MTFLSSIVQQAKSFTSHINLFIIDKGVFRFIRHQELAVEAQTNTCEVIIKDQTPMGWEEKHAGNNHMGIKSSRK